MRALSILHHHKAQKQTSIARRWNCMQETTIKAHMLYQQQPLKSLLFVSVNFHIDFNVVFVSFEKWQQQWQSKTNYGLLSSSNNNSNEFETRAIASFWNMKFRSKNERQVEMVSSKVHKLNPTIFVHHESSVINTNISNTLLWNAHNFK